MSLMQKIVEEMKIAMKSGEKLRLETLRSLRAQLQEKEIAKRRTGPLTEEDEMSILQSAIKKRKESIELFEKGGRKDLVEQETKEVQIIQTFLPRQLGNDEIERVVKKTIEEVEATSAKDFGKVMSSAMKTLKGKADGNTIQLTVLRLLERMNDAG